MIGALELVSISDFVLSALCLFLAGVLFGNIESHASGYGAICYFLLFSGLAALMGGVDHGFFEPIGERYAVRTVTFLFIAAATYFLFRYTIVVFFKGRVQRILLYIALAQLITFMIMSFQTHDYMLAVGNYTPALLLFLIMNVLHLRKGRTEMIFVLFCATSIVATLVQVLDVELFGMNGNTLYHVIGMAAYFLVFLGAKSISNDSGTLSTIKG
jgi:hypothetical protein